MRSNDRWIVQSLQVRSNGAFQNLNFAENATNGNGAASDSDNKEETIYRLTETISNASRSPYDTPQRFGNENEPHVAGVEELNEYDEDLALSEGRRANQKQIDLDS